MGAALGLHQPCCMHQHATGMSSQTRKQLSLINLVMHACAYRGKRSGVYGAFLLAVYDAEGEEYQTISKIGTGFSEEQLKAFSEELAALKIGGPKPYYRCRGLLLSSAPSFTEGHNEDTGLHAGQAVHAASRHVALGCKSLARPDGVSRGSCWGGLSDPHGAAAFARDVCS